MTVAVPRNYYPSEKLTSAFYLLASLTIPAHKRLAGAVWEIGMLEQHQDKLTEKGRTLYSRIMDMMGDGNAEERAKKMTEQELIEIGHLIRDLYEETESHFHGRD